jgi:hypothetical protein
MLAGEPDRAVDLVSNRRHGLHRRVGPDPRCIQRPRLHRVTIEGHRGRLDRHGHRAGLRGQLRQHLLHRGHRRKRPPELLPLTGIAGGVRVDALRGTGHHQ